MNGLRLVPFEDDLLPDHPAGAGIVVRLESERVGRGRSICFRIYFFGCLFVYLERLGEKERNANNMMRFQWTGGPSGRGLACGLCVCCNCTYKDKKFPREASPLNDCPMQWWCETACLPAAAANSTSIGPWNGKSPAQLDQEIEWRVVLMSSMFAY